MHPGVGALSLVARAKSVVVAYVVATLLAEQPLLALFFQAGSVLLKVVSALCGLDVNAVG